MSAAKTARWRPSPFVRVSAAVHVAGAGALLLQPGTWPAVAAAIAADHLLLFGAGLVPRSRLLGDNRSRLPDEAAARGEVAVTFDDGPDPVVTPAILDLLDRHGARATFFCIGERAARHGDIVQEIARRGHGLGNHSFSHPAGFALYGPARLRGEIDRTQEILAARSGRAPALFRAPAGIRGPLLDPVLHRCGLRLVSWTRRGYDTVTADPARVAARLGRGLAAGDILVLHDGGAARDPGGAPVVVEAAERLLVALKAARLTPVAL